MIVRDSSNNAIKHASMKRPKIREASDYLGRETRSRVNRYRAQLTDNSECAMARFRSKLRHGTEF